VYFSVILGAVQNFSQALTDNFLHEDAFDYQVIIQARSWLSISGGGTAERM
jgi:hypothetical protein